MAIIAVVHISIEIIQIKQAGMAISFPWYTALYVPGIFYYIPLLILALILLICCIHKKIIQLTSQMIFFIMHKQQPTLYQDPQGYRQCFPSQQRNESYHH